MSNQDQNLSMKDKLNLETAKIYWKELELFFAKGNLLCISDGEDLITVAELIASNDHQQIEKLILKQSIAFATPEWIKEHCQPETELWAVVVAPYVVCQLIE